MNWRLPSTVLMIFIAATPAAPTQVFHWDSAQAQVLTADQSLRKANLPEAEKVALVAAIQNQIGRQVDMTRNVALDARVLIVDLNRDGQPEVLAQPIGQYACSVDGNCGFWVFRKFGKAYKLLLDSVGQTFTLQPTYTNGFQDIVVAMHGSATEGTLKIYQYHSGRYFRVACYGADWQARDNPNLRLKEPRITPCRTNCGC
jgi:hypothetical protein